MTSVSDLDELSTDVRKQLLTSRGVPFVRKAVENREVDVDVALSVFDLLCTVRHSWPATQPSVVYDEDVVGKVEFECL